MSTTMGEVTERLTLADVLQQLGGVSPMRIRFRPAPGTANEEDVIKIRDRARRLFIRDRARRLFELTDGMMVEKALGYWESVLAIVLAGLLGNFVRRRKLGTLVGEAGVLRLSSGLSFISRARLAHHRRARASIVPVAPALATDVLTRQHAHGDGAKSTWILRFWLSPRLARRSAHSDCCCPHFPRQTHHPYRDADADRRRCPGRFPGPIAKVVWALGRSGIALRIGDRPLLAYNLAAK
jgi:hypothetical protein